MTVVSVSGDEVTHVLSDGVVTDVQVPPHSLSNCKGLVSVVLQDSITTIGENTFNGCENQNLSRIIYNIWNKRKCVNWHMDILLDFLISELKK